MKTNNKKITTFFILFIMIFSILLPNVLNVRAEEPKSNVHVHKLQYTNDLTEDKKLHNTGAELVLPEYVKPYEKSKYGDVQFGLFKFKDSVDVQNYMENVAKTKDYTGFTADSDPANFESVGSFASVSVNDLGKLSFNTVPKGKYLLAETKSSTNFVVTKAEPILLDLPIYNESGHIENFHVYPKNKTRALEIELTKYGEKNPNTLDGASFDLYKGEPGSGTKVTDTPLVTSAGKIKATGLTVGKYYLVENESANIGNLANSNTSGKKYVVSELAKNDANNKLVFNITETAITSDNLKCTLINYEAPRVGKLLENPDVSAGEYARFRIRTDIPMDICGKDDTATIGNTNQPKPDDVYNKFKIVDTFGAGFETEVKDLEVYAGNDRLDQGIDFTYTKTGNKFEIDFIVKNETNQKVSDKVKNNAGDQILVTYKLKIKADLTNASTLTNNAGFTYGKGTVVVEKNTNDKNDYNDIVNDNPTKPDDPSIPNQDPTNPQPGIEIYRLTVQKVQAGYINPGKLNGAKFKLMRKSDNKWLQPRAVWDTTGKWGDKDTAEEFITAGMEGSEPKGEFKIDGLSKGEYTLHETAAPENYLLNADPNTDVTLNDDIVKQVQNRPKKGLPFTGADKIIFVSLIGITIVSSGLVLVKRKNEKND